MPLVSRRNLLVRLRFRHADFKRLRNQSLMQMTHSSGRVFIVLWARALCFLASRLTTVSLDKYCIYIYIYLLMYKLNHEYIRTYVVSYLFTNLYNC